MKQEKGTPNKLINETSPYLLQHAYNPVEWRPWNDETLEKAKAENKLILISIGYSSCHWCHVMEHESFEDEEVARLMNEHFVCIKVDREERPDVDQVYMNAVQLISGQGGWPLNCFALPDGKPFWGGTYFPKEQWISILNNVVNIHKNQQKELEQQADNITSGISQTEVPALDGDASELTEQELKESFDPWFNSLDKMNGGEMGAPKFPMPVNLKFLLRYSRFVNDPEVLAQVKLTLNKMAEGGIYDHIGGGFSRYSVDTEWKVPHFEKMLYDNAQLVSIYSEAYRATRIERYHEVVEETLGFIQREMTSEDGVFYSALDADSEGHEGRYYVWTKAEIQEVLDKEADLFISRFNVGGKGLWEDNQNILIRTEDDEKFAAKFQLSLDEMQSKINKAKEKLLEQRRKRTAPGLDDKIITSWNALMIKGYVDAYHAFGNPDYLENAIRALTFILENMKTTDNRLLHSYKNGQAKINGFMEDYALLTEALIACYEVTFDEHWLHHAENLIEVAIEDFFDAKTGMFYFVSKSDRELIARKAEIMDNVIPASNSVMANKLFRAGLLLEKGNYMNIALKQLKSIKSHLLKYPSAFANWGSLAMNHLADFHTIAITGPKAFSKAREFTEEYNPFIMLCGNTKPSDLPILQNRFIEGETMIYVCTTISCLEPVKEVVDAKKIMAGRPVWENKK